MLLFLDNESIRCRLGKKGKIICQLVKVILYLDNTVVVVIAIVAFDL